jgi:tagatose-6-phosphate ketose/aldose isomerase
MVDNQLKQYLGYNVQELKAKEGIHTAMEISAQPKLWLATWVVVEEQRELLEEFLDEVYSHENLDIILTGAGTSAFIGTILQGPFQRNTRKRTRAVPSTDLVSHPEDFFYSLNTTLLISFARSGNSPESVAAVDLANKFCKKVFHLIITCNETGKLASNVDKNQTFVFLLPPEADDQALAMTGSFTSMLLSALLISRLSYINDLRWQVEKLAEYGEIILDKYLLKLKDVANLNFRRAVFLGSGPLLGTARESHLKLQELTDGQVICKYDSFLGLRHGPKAVIDSSTLLIYLFSNNEYVHQYEVDLVNTINAGEKGLYSIGIYETNGEYLGMDLKIELSSGGEKIDEEFLSVCSVLPAQILGFFKSLQLGLKPDSPSVTGAITRVVEGVTIYPFIPVLQQNVV